MRKLPERAGAIRLIEIADYDLNACGGTHVQSTGQIGGLLLRSTEKVRHGLRVEFVCGLRAVTTARREYELLSRSSAALSVGSEKLPQAIERLLAGNKSAGKVRQKLREQLADLQAAQLITQTPPSNDLRIIRQVFEKETDGLMDADYCKLLASRIIARSPRMLVLFATRDATKESLESQSAAVIVAASKGQNFSCGDLLRAEFAKLGQRGGGSREMAQGQLPCEQVDELLNAVEAVALAAQSSISAASTN